MGALDVAVTRGDQQQFGFSARWLLREDACAQHLRVVDDDERRANRMGQVEDAGVLLEAFVLVDDREAGAVSFGERGLRDQVLGEVEFELTGLHGGLLACPGRTGFSVAVYW